MVVKRIDGTEEGVRRAYRKATAIKYAD